MMTAMRVTVVPAKLLHAMISTPARMLWKAMLSSCKVKSGGKIKRRSRTRNILRVASIKNSHSSRNKREPPIWANKSANLCKKTRRTTEAESFVSRIILLTSSASTTRPKPTHSFQFKKWISREQSAQILASRRKLMISKFSMRLMQT